MSSDLRDNFLGVHFIASARGHRKPVMPLFRTGDYLKTSMQYANRCVSFTSTVLI